MNPLSAIFGAGAALRNRLYDSGTLAVHKLARPVVSVGNISVGGSGKTPFVIALGEMLKARGIDCDVLSRGYGRESSGTAIVDPAGSPGLFGDEPLLIARKLQVPVVVGADRYQAGLLAEKNFTIKIHLLDDAFQHRRLHRDFDIVILSAADLNGDLLPVGRLREPLSSLRRADAIVSDLGESEAVEAASLLGSRSASPLDTVEKAMEAREIRRIDSAPLRVLPAEMWRVKRNIYLDEVPKNPVVFCGIARPHQFFGQLRELGLELAETISFADHHRYTKGDIDRLLRIKGKAGADAFVTTEKDAINLGPLAARLQPLRIAQLRVILEHPEQMLETLLSTLERRGRRL
ncbi:MAG TPA: tetraacyldisaccharide 4'-kinase [Candidatus Angelobacter sp.]|nr:tetraacyldisaccharide 4'-kinase [Candidatus Angelobacter sp.]